MTAGACLTSESAESLLRGESLMLDISPITDPLDIKVFAVHGSGVTSSWGAAKGDNVHGRLVWCCWSPEERFCKDPARKRGREDGKSDCLPRDSRGGSLNDGRGSGSAKGGTTEGKLGKLGKLGGPGNSTSRLARELKEPCRVELASLDPCADITRLAIHEMLSAIHLGWGGCRVLPPSASATLLLTRGTAAPKAGAFACVSSCASIGPSREVVCRERALVGAVDKFSMDNGGTLKH